MVHEGQHPAAQLSRHLARELSWGLTGYPGSGEVCRIIIGDDAAGHRLDLRLHPHGVEVLEGSRLSADATVWVSSEVANLLLKEAHSVDMRDRRVRGGIRYEGNSLLVSRLGQALLRPPAEMRAIYESAEQRAASSPRATVVERVHRPSAAAVQAAVDASRPVVATGLLDHCLPESWEALAQRVGGMTIHPPSLEHPLPLSEFVSQVLARKGSDATYSDGCMLPPSALEMFRPAFGDDGSPSATLPFGPPQLWAGISDSSQAVTALHRDPSPVLLMQLLGRKRVLLYSPLERDNLYPVKTYNTYQNCWVDPLKPRLDVHAKFKDAMRLEVELAPGEVLVNPAGWFHCVVIDGPTFSVSVPLKG